MRYFLVTCPRGHMGANHYTEITFALYANNLLDALQVARKMPGVKHSKLPFSGKEISYEEYKKYKSKGAY